MRRSVHGTSEAAQTSSIAAPVELGGGGGGSGGGAADEVEAARTRLAMRLVASEVGGKVRDVAAGLGCLLLRAVLTRLDGEGNLGGWGTSLACDASRVTFCVPWFAGGNVVGAIEVWGGVRGNGMSCVGVRGGETAFGVNYVM